MQHILLDTETTDVGWNARLVQLGYKILETGESVNELFKPPHPIDIGAMAVHHITNEMVHDKPAFQDTEHKQKLQKLLDDHILVAHNANYDMTILYHEGITTRQYIDTVRVAKHVIESPRHGLQYLRYFLGLTIEATAHDAFGDVLILEQLFNRLRQATREKFSLESDEAVSEKMLELTQTPVLLSTIRFGKYKATPFEKIFREDPGYLEWLLGSESAKKESEQDEELLYTLKYYLKID